MLNLADIRIKPKLLILFILTGVLPLLIVGFLSSRWTERTLIDESFRKLTTIQDIRKGQIESYFQQSFVDIRLLADSERIYNFLRVMNTYEENLDTSSFADLQTENQDFERIIKDIRKPLQDYTILNGYKDLYLLDAEHGHVLFSLEGRSDRGANLLNGSLKNSALGRIWQQVSSTVATVITDFEPYGPADNEEMAFIGHPIANKSGEKIGVVVLRFNASLVSRIAESRKGMGKSGESYVIGYLEDSQSFEFRSNMQTMGEGKYVVGYDLGKRLDYWQAALQAGNGGGHGIYIDSAGNQVLVAFDKLNMEGLNWFLISKIDEAEVTLPMRSIYKNEMLVALLLILFVGLEAWFFSKSLTTPIIEDMKFADAISHGELGKELSNERKDELGDLARSLNSMAKNLKESNWLKSGKEQLDDFIRGELEPDELARRCIAFYTKHLGAGLGAFYLTINGSLELRASYAFTDRQGNHNAFSFGEGMVGQAALEGEILVFSHIKEDAPPLNFGAGELVPSHFLVAPIHNEGDVLGVMLIGSVEPFDELQKKFISQNITGTAIRLSAAKSRQSIAKLLLDAQARQEELRHANEGLEEQTTALKTSEAALQSQQEELRVINEELEEQTRALKESEAELQAQQEELQVSNEELAEQTRALEEQRNEIWAKNSDLKEAQEIVEKKVKELEVASKYKSEFLANMSHELRTPLNSILILSQLLSSNKGGNLSQKQIESAVAINTSGADLLNLINEILDLSKVEAGKIDLVMENVPLVQIEKDLSRLYSDIAESKGIQFVINQEEELPEAITTDAQRLQQVLRNLLTNAFKFTSKGKVTLSISRPQSGQLKNTALDGKKAVSFAVIDEGIGIPEDKQSVIFEAFQQVDGSTSRKYGGTGLGLSISKELTRLLGGFIHLHSIEGKGSTFAVIVPEIHTPVDYHHTQVQVTALQTVSRSSTLSKSRDRSEKKKTVKEKESTHDSLEVEDDRKDISDSCKSLLIIEDDNRFSRILRDLAREQGFKCIIAEDGETGLHFADYYKPSAIILDIGLPGIDGWTVMERLKDNPQLRHIPVHFMSAADSSMNAMRMGAIGYLTKPVSVEKIEETFRKLENMIANPVSRLLLVEDDPLQRESIKELIGNSDVKTTAVATGHEAYDELEKGGYDCMILDLGLEDMSGFELLEKIRANDALVRVPIIIYTGRDLTEEEENKLKRYAESIIIKGVKSPERLLDESALFLHRIEANLPEDKRKMLKMVHDKEGVLSGRKILLVDDDMRNVFALTSVLEERNIEVVIARDGLESLEKLKENINIDAILMDIMMPKMDGYEAMRQIRKNSKWKKLPIIALTAKAMKGDRTKCIEAGASDYLAKPVDPDKLLSMLRVWLY